MSSKNTLASFHELFLVPADAFSEIMGPVERVVAAGSSLRLVCSLRNASSPPSFVFWYQGRRMINYDTDRNVQVSKGKDYRWDVTGDNFD